MATDADAERESVAQETMPAPDEGEPSSPTRALPRWTIFGVPSFVIAVVGVMGRIFGVGPAILILAAAALLTVVGFLFRAVQSVAEPHEDEDALASLPPTLAEEQKRAALRALKELEFEKSVGNISPDDYAVIVERYRDEAKRAMRAVDEERKTMRERAEKLARKAIRAEVGDEVVDAKANPFPAPEETTAPAKAEKADEASENLCAKCAMNNDDDARFCKACGAPMGDVA